MVKPLNCLAAPRSHGPWESIAKRTHRIIFRLKCGPLLHRLGTNVLESPCQIADHGQSSNSKIIHMSADVNYVARGLGISSLYERA